jgi:hypothetical protein
MVRKVSGLNLPVGRQGFREEPAMLILGRVDLPSKPFQKCQSCSIDVEAP